MRAGPERRADVLGERADIGSLAAANAQLDERRSEAEELEAADLHRATRALDALALARELVERHAVALQRRMHRRHLLDGAAKAAEDRLELGRRHLDRALLEHAALGVAGARAAAELERREVLLVGVEKRPGELGRLAEKHDEQARCQRVERAGVAGLPRMQRALRRLQRGVRAQAERLVEEQRAVAHFLRLAASIRRERRSPRSTDSSYSKRSSGVV